MTPCIPENVPSWLVNWRFITKTMPPRAPNDDDDDAEDEEDEEGADLEPPVVREPLRCLERAKMSNENKPEKPREDDAQAAPE